MDVAEDMHTDLGLGLLARVLCTLLTGTAAPGKVQCPGCDPVRDPKQVVTAAPDVRVLEPEFNAVPQEMSYSRGDTARLFCSVSHLGERTIVWRKLPKPNPLTIGLDTYVEDARLHVEHVHKHDQWNLIIERVRPGDQGQYECQVSMKERSLRRVVQLQVIDVPVKRNPDILIRGREFVSRGGTIELVCNATSLSDSGQRLEWVKDGNVLTWQGYGGRVSISAARSRHTPTVTSLLRVRGVTVDDAGDYTCRSSDLMHMTSMRVIITTGGLSNNVKRAGSMISENCAVGCLPRDIANFFLVLLMFVCHYVIT